jgi:hypothetical protein
VVVGLYLSNSTEAVLGSRGGCDHGSMTATNPDMVAALPEVAREVEDFVAGGGWDQPPQLFALVPTAELLAAEPGMAAQLDAAAPLTPIAQEPLAEPELDVALAGIAWPDGVAGCAVVQEIVVLPPEVESALSDDAAGAPAMLTRLAATHPSRREARLVAAVLRDGPGACLLRLRGGDDALEELVEHPDLAPNLIEALRGTFEP